jgi:hypothetical protein
MTNQLKLPPDQERFRLEHEILEKQKKMDELVARHNHLVSLVPKELTEDVLPDAQLAMQEIDANMKQLLAVMEELEADCARSPFFRKQTIEAKSDTSA